jgi:hypothetical protein
MTIVAILIAVGAYGELYVALGERSPWGTLFVALVLAFLSNVAARMAVQKAAAVSTTAGGSQHSTMRAISQQIARSVSAADKFGDVAYRGGLRLDLAPFGCFGGGACPRRLIPSWPLGVVALRGEAYGRAC